MKPVYSLTPLTLGQILDRSFRLYRRNFFTFVGIVAVVQIIVAIFTALPAISPLLSIVSGLGSVLAGLLNIFVSAALAIAIIHAYMDEPIGIGEAFSQMTPWMVALFLVAVIGFGAGIGVVIWTIIPLLGWFTGPGILFFVSTALVLAGPIVVIEQIDGPKAVRRAWDLCRRRFWPVAGFIAIIGILSLIITSPILALTFGLIFTFGPEHPYTILGQSFGTLLVGALYTPFQYTAYVLLYLDLRVRNEGLDIELIGQGEEQTAAKSPITLLRNAPPAQSGNWITGTEFRDFFLLSLIFIGVFVALFFIIITLGLTIPGLF